MRQQIIVAVGAALLAAVFLAVWVLSLPDTPAGLLTASPTPPPAPTAIAASPAGAPQPTAPAPAATPLPPDAAIPQPTALPTPTPAIAATPAPTAVAPPPTLMPTAVPPPTAVATPTPTATPLPTAIPTATPVPTPTPLPPLFIVVDCPGWYATVRRPGDATVAGRTLPNSDVTIRNNIRGQGLITRSGIADAAGRFAIPIILNPGNNALEVRADHGTTGSEFRTFWSVFYEPTSGQPEIRIDEPRDCAAVSANPLPIAGKTEPGATVLVNDFSATVDSDGNWRVLVRPEQGSYPITAVATLDGNTAADSITVIYRRNTPAPWPDADR